MSNIPISTLKLETVNINSKNIVGETKVIYKDVHGILVGINNSPHSLFANAGFDLNRLPTQLHNDILNCKGVLLRPYTSFDDEKGLDFIDVPEWLGKMKELKILTIEGVLNDNNKVLDKISLHNLVFNSLYTKNKKSVLDSIATIKGLIYIIHNNSISQEDIAYLKAKMPQTRVLGKNEYEMKINNGEIPHM